MTHDARDTAHAGQQASGGRWPPRMGQWLFVLALALIALLPRVLDLGLFLDSDESNFWMGRAERFLHAIQSGQFADTAISTHPGVTTMWLGVAGTLLRRTLFEWGLLQATPFPVVLTFVRLPVALLHTGGVLLGYALLRRMFAPLLAMLAVLLWAADPFLIAYQRILHVDGLSGTFATLSLLAACVYWHHRGSVGFLLLSAACGALAVLSKSPALALLPVVALIGLWGMGGRGWGGVWPFALWGAVFALTIVLVWPAVWADPLRVYQLLRAGVAVEGSSPHMIGNFFLGRENDAPGPLFYPVALALRLTPWTLAGLLLLPLAWRLPGAERALQRRDLAMLALLVLLFVIGLSLFPKKINRYIVPAFAAVDILAAAGLVWSLRYLLVQRLHLTGGRLRAAAGGLFGLAAAAAALNAAWWHPYYVVAFNQVLGGAQAGARTFLLGDGEGLREAAEWLNQQPDITGVRTLSSMINSFQPFLRHGAQSVSPDDGKMPDRVGYVMLYIRHVQRGGTWPGPPYDRFYHHATPLHTVTIHGIEYAWVYQVPPPIAHEVDARFGQHITLRGYEVDSSALRASGVLSLTVQWRTDDPVQRDYLLFAHVLDEEGQRVAQVDVPPAGPDMPPVSWQPGRYITWVHPIFVPADLPPGAYWLALGLYDPDDFTRLPVAPEPPAAAPDAGGNALLLPLTIEAGEAP